MSEVVWEREGGDGKRLGSVLAWGLRRVVASLGVEAIAEFAKGGKKPSGYTDTGVIRITDQP